MIDPAMGEEARTSVISPMGRLCGDPAFAGRQAITVTRVVLSRQIGKETVAT
jgi:hypothetical protein